MTYSHTMAPLPAWYDRDGEYCTRCRAITPTGDCTRHPEYPHVVVPAPDVRPGDIISVATGINREIESFAVHSVHAYTDGSMSLRARPASYPRAVDWSLYVAPGEPTLRVLSRGVSHVDHTPRSLLPW